MRARDRQTLLQLVREVARRQLAPRAARYEVGDEFPAELFAPLAELDLLGLPFAIEDGGGGQPQTVVCDVLAELSRAFMPVGLGTAAHLAGTAAVAANATPTVRAEVLPRLVAGEWLVSCGFPPTAQHSAVVADPLRASHDGDRYVLDGTAVGVGHADIADCFVLFCTLGPPSGHRLAALLVPADTPGLRPSRAVHSAGSPIGQVVCRAASVPADHRLGTTDDTQAIAIDARDVSRVGVAACAVGLARAALHAAIACAHRSRATAGGADDHVTDGLIADLAATVEAADALCHRAAAARDSERQSSLLAALAALSATDTAFRVADAAARMTASSGWDSAHPVERYRQEATALQRLEGSHRAPVSQIAHELLGERGTEGSM